jgi:ankyrin repeat protein
MSEANVNSLNPSGSTLIHTAVRTGNVDMLELILSFRPHSMDVKEGDSVGGGTPLHVAAMLGDDKMVALLIKHGAQAKAQVTVRD